MEDVLEVYSRPYDEDYPVICMDEKPVQFFADFRKGFRSKKDGVQYEDSQYIRNGTASIFLFTEPLAGWRYADAQEKRTAPDWAKHGSWLDIAEIELSALGRQCIANNRIPDLPSLRNLLEPWAVARNIAQKGVDWHFTTDDARTKLKHLYPIIKI